MLSRRVIEGIWSRMNPRFECLKKKLLLHLTPFLALFFIFFPSRLLTGILGFLSAPIESDAQQLHSLEKRVGFIGPIAPSYGAAPASGSRASLVLALYLFMCICCTSSWITSFVHCAPHICGSQALSWGVPILCLVLGGFVDLRGLWGMT